MPWGWVVLTENRVVSLRQGKILGSCGHSPRCKLCLQQVEVGANDVGGTCRECALILSIFRFAVLPAIVDGPRWITTCIYCVNYSASGPFLYNLFWWISCLVSLHWKSSLEGCISSIRELIREAWRMSALYRLDVVTVVPGSKPDQKYARRRDRQKYVGRIK